MIYVTSDLHGIHPDKFQEFLDRSGFTDADFLFILGDVIDRGEHGTELLLWLTQQGNMQLILGNHEAFMLGCEFLFDEVTEDTQEILREEELRILKNWLRNGGGTTIAGLRNLFNRDSQLIYGILDYLHDAPLWDRVEAGGRQFILVHGGLGNFQPEKPMDSYAPHDLLWERPELDCRYFTDATVIFGHTPTEFYGPEYKGRALHTDSWICIDTGAACGGSPMLLRLDDMREFYIE